MISILCYKIPKLCTDTGRDLDVEIFERQSWLVDCELELEFQLKTCARDIVLPAATKVSGCKDIILNCSELYVGEALQALALCR